MGDMKVRIAGTMSSIKDVDPQIIREWDAAIAKENAKDRYVDGRKQFACFKTIFFSRLIPFYAV